MLLLVTIWGGLLHVTEILKVRREDFEGRTNKPLKDMGTEEVYLNTLLLVLCASVRWKRVVSLQVCDQGKCKHSTVSTRLNMKICSQTISI